MDRQDDAADLVHASERDEGVKTPGGLPQEDVDDRPDVSSVTPEDYPLDQRAEGDVQPPVASDEERSEHGGQ